MKSLERWRFGCLPSSPGMFKDGKLRHIAVAVAAARRVPQMLDSPTVAEAKSRTYEERVPRRSLSLD